MLERRSVLKAMAISVGGLLLPASLVHASLKPRVTDVRFASTPSRTRIVFSLNHEVKHTLSLQKDPPRVLLDLADTELTSHPTLLSFSDQIVDKVRTTALANGNMRTTFDLNALARSRAFILKNEDGTHPRLIVDFMPIDPKTASNAASDPDDDAQPEPVRRYGKRKVIIVLDPGHGGIDPGAIGARGVREKDVTLEVAKRVAKEINATPGYKAYLTRTDDKFVALSRRCALASRYQADLFISLHADAFHIPSARGASVYCLSERNGDTTEAVDQRSMMLGNTLLSSIARTPSLSLHFKTTKQARFAVLKTRNIPSVLVEMAFLSNRQEEILMKKNSHQESLAKAVSQGARNFIESSRTA